MDSGKVEAKTKVLSGKVSGEPKTSTKTTRTKSGGMIVEVTTIFEVDNPDEVFSLEGSGITMSLDAQN